MGKEQMSMCKPWMASSQMRKGDIDFSRVENEPNCNRFN